MAFCSNCGNKLQDGNNICLKCNYQNAPLVSSRAQQTAVIVQQKSKSGGYLKWLETKTWSAMLDIAAFLIGFFGLVLFLLGLAAETYPACFGGCGLLILAFFLRTKAQYYDEQVVLMR